MNNWIKSGLGISVAGLLVLLATHGKQLADALLALWMFVFKAADAAPLGVASFGVALSLAVLSRYFLRKWLPSFKCPLSRDALIDLSALVVGTAVVWVQMLDVEPVERIKALWIGLMAGFMTPHVYNGFAALRGLLSRSMTEKTDDPA